MFLSESTTSTKHGEAARRNTIVDSVHKAATEPGEDQLRETIRRVENMVAPVWPLDDYVAVNPFLGLADESFMDARRRLRSVSEAEILLPLEYFRHKLDSAELTREDIEAAIDEINADTFAPRISVSDVLNGLHDKTGKLQRTDNPDRTVRALTEIVDLHAETDWTRIVCEEIGRHCASHYDKGQAAWPVPWQNLGLYQAWRSAARIDRRLSALGVSQFCQFADKLPHNAEACVVALLRRLNVPSEQWESFLCCLAMTIPGWCAWTRYQTQQAERSGRSNNDFTGLLAIRLAYDVAIAESEGYQVDWASIAKLRNVIGRTARNAAATDAELRYVLQRASELAYQRQVVESLSQTENLPESDDEPTTAVAQMVFCIDVRSERYRRHLETNSDGIRTYGFAGFFGVPIAVKGPGEAESVPHVPALLSPSFAVSEHVIDSTGTAASEVLRRRSIRRLFRKSWKQFSASASSCFGFVETSGLAYGWALMKKTFWGTEDTSRFDGIAESDRDRLGPDLTDLSAAGITAEQQIDMAESILRGIGITSDFASVVVFCGHRSTTQNNPLQAGLDCGACCGHSGEPNARFAASLLNQSIVRHGLRERGIVIPEETCFVAAVHDTTTDQIHIPSPGDTSLAAGQALEHLRQATERATLTCRIERMPSLRAESPANLEQRSRDWSEIRPEWGLAGNAAFIVGPRSLTMSKNLAGRSFLHSYDFRADADFKVLEQIMTAPMVVAHWINMQYYASAVDNQHYGSGTKTIHNVVGQFGLLSGNGGDLTTGLAWESVHDGDRLIHEPLRLLTVIDAPRDAVAAIIARHNNVRDLLTNDWMHLLVKDEEQFYRFTPQQTWQKVSQSALEHAPEETNMAEVSS